MIQHFHQKIPKSQILLKAIDYLKNKAPDSPSFGENNVFISEIGQPEIYYPPQAYNKESGTQNIDVLKEQISTALSLGIPYVNIWTLYDNECAHLLPRQMIFVNPDVLVSGW